MQSNIYCKKIESENLSKKVNEFLEKTGKKEPDQIPFGLSLKTQNQRDSWQSSQESMRQAMTRSVSQKRPVLQKKEKCLTKEQKRQKINFEKRNEAIKNGETTFEGECLNHGLTTFKVYQKSRSHRCIACQKAPK